jgi:hypothetical protein
MKACFNCSTEEMRDARRRVQAIVVAACEIRTSNRQRNDKILDQLRQPPTPTPR